LAVPATVDTHQRFSEAWESFFRTTRRLRARAGRLPGELSVPQYQLLEPLRRTHELCVGELADAAGVAAPTATRMLDGLARNGLITRRHSEVDRRSVIVSLTAEGETALEEAHGVVDAWRRQVLESLEPAEREHAAALLERLSEVMEAQL
jgi:MarR family transcriptional regulator, organic hydroperoxide resistance regulator